MPVEELIKLVKMETIITIIWFAISVSIAMAVYYLVW